MKDLIQKEFDKISMPHKCTEEIRQIIATSQPVRKKSLRILPRILIAAALTLCLFISVAAVGIQKGWLDPFLGSSESTEDIKELMLTTQDGEMKVTLERMLADGPFLYLQVTIRTKGNVNAVEAFEGSPMLPESGIQRRLYITYTDGEQTQSLSEQGQNMTNASALSSDGPFKSWHITRLDDGSDVNFCSYTMQILLAELPANYEGLNLTLRLDKQREWVPGPGGVYTTEEREMAILEETFTLSDKKAEVRTMEDGRMVKIHSLGVQIQGADFAFKPDESTGMWNDCGVMLKDGTKVPFTKSFTAKDYYTEDMQWNVCHLSRIIDPQNVTSIYVGETVYPLK